MTNILKTTNHKIVSGIEIYHCETTYKVHLPVSRVKHHMSAPVSWNGKLCSLYFLNWQRSAGLNNLATDLFARPGFHIYGPAIVAAPSGTWRCLRVQGSGLFVRDSISHLTLGEHAIVPTSRRDTHQDVIAKDLADITMLKMVL